MKVLIVGNGGREHALTWKVAQSPKVTQVYVAPGNAGTKMEPKTINVDISVTDIDALLQFAQNNQIELTIVGPEAPLSLGITDAFLAAGLRCFGPTKAAARLETSKIYSKEFMMRYGIPTASHCVFEDFYSARSHLLLEASVPVVIKADGLAGGKGVAIAHSYEEAIATLEDLMIYQIYGSAGQKIVIENYLEGEEVSIILMVNGTHFLPLATSQDHKRRDSGDCGPNTGGMGAYSPIDFVTPKLYQTILEAIIVPTLAHISITEGCPYTGFLYLGLIITKEGPKVLEYNCRLGDPEAQAILMRMKSDLVDLCLAATDNQLHKHTIEWDPRPALSVVMATEGYPEQYKVDEVINGLSNDINTEDSKIFHAGTRYENDKILTAGGRVLSVTTLGSTIKDAQKKAYQIVQKIHWDNVYFRNDIGYRAVEREQ